MNPHTWLAGYLVGTVAWFTYNLVRVAKKVTDGSVSYWPEATQRTRKYLFVAMFWNTVCAAALWPGSLILQLVGVVVFQLDELEGDE